MKILLQEVLPIIEKTAPTIAKALGFSGLSGVAPWAVYLLSKAFGVKMDEVEKLPNAISSDPAYCDKLCQVEKTFSKFVGKSGMELPKNFNLTNAEINIKLSFDQTNTSVSSS